jgi:hypothetical protein
MIMNWKRLGINGPGLTSRYYLGIRLEELRKTTKTPQEGRDLNPGAPEYEVGVLTTRPRRSIYNGLIRSLRCRGIHIMKARSGWVEEPVWSDRDIDENICHIGTQTPSVQPVGLIFLIHSRNNYRFVDCKYFRA